MSAIPSALILLLVPAVTGLASVLWSPIAGHSWVGMAALNTLASGSVWLILVLARPGDPDLLDVVATFGWPFVASYVALSMVVSLLWFSAHETTGVVWIAFSETGWGFFALVFTLLLCRIPGSPIRPLEVSIGHLAGGALIIAGVCLIAVAGRGAVAEIGGGLR